MFKKLRWITIVLAIMSAFTLVGCGDKRVESETPTLNATELELAVGETFELKVNDYDGEIEWGTDNFKVVSVSDDGVVTCLDVGEATVTAYLNDMELTCKIVSKIEYVAVPKLVLDGELADKNGYGISLRLDDMHDQYELSPILMKNGESLSSVSFKVTSADASKVEVDGTTLIAKAITDGVKITVSCDYEGKTYTTIVNVVVKGV